MPFEQFVTLILAAWALPSALAQPAPVGAPSFRRMRLRKRWPAASPLPEGGEQAISIPGATWLQLQLSDVKLGPAGTLTITSCGGRSQSFSQAELEAWGGLTAIFNGSELRVTLTPGPGATEPVVGPGATSSSACQRRRGGGPQEAEAVPQPLIDLLAVLTSIASSPRT